MPLLRDEPELWPHSVVCGQAVHHCCCRHGRVWGSDGGGGHRGWSTAHRHDPTTGAALWGEWRPARTPLPERGAAGHDGESREGACGAAGFCWVRPKPPVWVRIGMQEGGRVCCCRKHAGSVFFPPSRWLLLSHRGFQCLSGGSYCFRAASSRRCRKSCQDRLRVLLPHVRLTLFEMQVWGIVTLLCVLCTLVSSYTADNHRQHREGAWNPSVWTPPAPVQVPDPFDGCTLHFEIVLNKSQLFTRHLPPLVTVMCSVMQIKVTFSMRRVDGCLELVAVAQSDEVGSWVYVVFLLQ